MRKIEKDIVMVWGKAVALPATNRHEFPRLSRAGQLTR
jgi:hypothetical protein